ncbi:MAG: 2-amino-4-hydroxy-6-hydroxymethyldihydropteridine diphosphokinase, partial [Mesorhizobium sp.]|nr:2-amino-4-hydroxy-6-hydroxymethyldihydropteridine diphosphokinase [Mesorhizobium sp.]
MAGTSTAYLSLGGNLGDPAASMSAALAMLDDDPATKVAAVSSLYRTPPWGKTDQPDFLNAAAELSTALSARALHAWGTAPRQPDGIDLATVRRAIRDEE